MERIFDRLGEGPAVRKEVQRGLPFFDFGGVKGCFYWKGSRSWEKSWAGVGEVEDWRHTPVLQSVARGSFVRLRTDDLLCSRAKEAKPTGGRQNFHAACRPPDSSCRNCIWRGAFPGGLKPSRLRFRPNGRFFWQRHCVRCRKNGLCLCLGTVACENAMGAHDALMYAAFCEVIR